MANIREVRAAVAAWHNWLNAQATHWASASEAGPYIPGQGSESGLAILAEFMCGALRPMRRALASPELAIMLRPALLGSCARCGESPVPWPWPGSEFCDRCFVAATNERRADEARSASVIAPGVVWSRPNPPPPPVCPVCNYPRPSIWHDGESCGGCAEPCPTCGFVHRRAPSFRGRSSTLSLQLSRCVQALGKIALGHLSDSAWRSAGR